MRDSTELPGYGWGQDAPHSHSYIDPEIVRITAQLGVKDILDLGCGNGVLCGKLHQAGYHVEGCELDIAGGEIARTTYPDVKFHQVGVYDPPPFASGSFDLVVSTEVIEHLYAPEYLLRFAGAVLKKNGVIVISTPYHGYLKNLLMALFGRWDLHHHPQNTGWHIKFWSRRTLSQLLEREGFTVCDFQGAGRLRWLWKSMIVVARWNGFRD